MKIVVTGSAGFAGSHIIDHLLLKTDWDIVGLDSFKHRGDSLRVQNNPRYKIYGLDLSKPISHRVSEQIGQVDYIINCASESHVDRSITDPVPFVENNVSLALNMLEFARHHKVKAFIQISTDEVYGAAPEGIDHKEWFPIIPSNPYSASKAAQEAIAISYWRTYNVPVIITNTMNMFGERQDKEKFIPMTIKNIFEGKEVPIHGTREYIGKRHYLHSRNHADALLWLLQNTKPTMYHDDPNLIITPDRYNVVGDVELDNLKLAETIAEIMEMPLEYTLVDFHAARPGHDRRYSLDGNKIKDLGWTAPVSFYESLKKTIHWTLENKAWLK